MVKASAVVCYHGTVLKAVSVIAPRGIKEIYRSTDGIKANSWKALYAFVVSLAASYGFKIPYTEMDGLRYYNILFYDELNPINQQTLALPKETD